MDLRRPIILALAALALLAAGCGDDEGTTVAGDTATTTSEATTEPAPDPPEAKPKEDQGREGVPEPDKPPKPKRKEGQPSDAEKLSAADEATAAYTNYIDAIEAKDGGALCSLLPPGFERELKPPVQKGECASTLEASIGYEDPRGFPVWTGTTLNSVQRASIGADPSTARLTAMIVTAFEGREPSVESDIAYLELAAGEWRLAQPTGALYRAIGNPEPPPQAIAPPAK